MPQKACAQSPHRGDSVHAVSASAPPGCSARYRDAWERIARLAKFDSLNVLLSGERGVGKTYHAKVLHDLSPRASGPFHAVPLSTLYDEVSVSDLFGHERGAFSGAILKRPGLLRSAVGGTLFLDEVAKSSIIFQGRLLGITDSRMYYPVGGDTPQPVQARLVLAASEDLRAMAERGTFRPDLLDRINAHEVYVPPLRDCKEDIPRLVIGYVSANASKFGYRTPPRVSDELIDLFLKGSWPGNVRQLFKTCEQVMVEADGAPVLLPTHVPDGVAGLEHCRRKPLPRSVAERYVEIYGNQTRAAEALGCSRKTVNKVLRKAAGSPAPAKESLVRSEAGEVLGPQ
jgi:DNA-binding NtrC family response regulator